MKYKGKTISVRIVGEADEAYQELNKIVGKEVRKDIKSSESQTLLRGIQRNIELLKQNVHYGFNIPKKQIPKKYIDLYGVNNLWKINLPNHWRLIYTIRSDEVEIINLILDIYDHPTYSKVFGYKKK